ncbi:hypothetical protein DRN62_00510 [Nanoarchaeota archaeon]|nr:MAG: hypothetical protein DRN62_00510 [Nanoarchaeota archaeon]
MRITLGFEYGRCDVCGEEKQVRILLDDKKAARICADCANRLRGTSEEVLLKYGKPYKRVEEGISIFDIKLLVVDEDMWEGFGEELTEYLEGKYEVTLAKGRRFEKKFKKVERGAISNSLSIFRQVDFKLAIDPKSEKVRERADVVVNSPSEVMQYL